MVNATLGNDTFNATLTTRSNATASDVASAVASGTLASINDAVLSETLMYVVILVLGLVTTVLGMELPMLLAGMLAVGIFNAMLMRSGQEDSPDVSQWEFWPWIILLSTVIVMSVLVYFAKKILTSTLVGMLLAILGLLIVAAIPAIEVIPLGAIIAVVLFAIGFTVSYMWSEEEKGVPRPMFALVLSVCIGGSLFVNSCYYFANARNIFMELAHLLSQSEAVKTEAGAEAVAEDARIMIIAWIATLVGLTGFRYLLIFLFGRYAPQRLRESRFAPKTFNNGSHDKFQDKGDRYSADPEQIGNTALADRA